MNKYLHWLIDKKEYISINKIETELYLPQGTLKKFVDGKRELPKHWHAPVIAWITGFIKIKRASVETPALPKPNEKNY